MRTAVVTSRLIDFAEFTFTPCRGGRFRCNQTGAVVKDTKRYRKMKERELYPSDRNVGLPEGKIFSSGRAICPHCGYINNRVTSPVIVCLKCENKFVAPEIKQPEIRPEVRVGALRVEVSEQPSLEPEGLRLKRAKRDPEGDVTCPHCYRYNLRVGLGSRLCGNCQKLFFVC